MVNFIIDLHDRLTIFVDGFGILHHIEFGYAYQIGLQLDIPRVGIGIEIRIEKTVLYCRIR